MSIRHDATGPMSTREHVGLGIAYGYPICCVARFALDRKRGRLSGKLRGRRFTERPGGVFVPCGIFHRKHADV